MCRNGYDLALDGMHCLYKGVCDAQAHGCEQACRFVGDSYACECRIGFVMNRTRYNTCQGE